MAARGLPVAIVMALAGCATARAGDRGGAPPRSERSAPRDQLDKGDIVSGMQAVRPVVQRCFERYKVPGMYEAALTIAGTGRVTAVHIRGPHVESNDCVGHAVATAAFPPFGGAPQSIVYPYLLR